MDRPPPPDHTISAALSAAINEMGDPELRIKFDIVVAKAACALSAARAVSFLDMETQELEGADVRSRVVPRFTAVFREVGALADAMVKHFPEAVPGEEDISDDFDRAFNLLQGGGPGEAPASAGGAEGVAEKIADLMRTYAHVIRRELSTEAARLQGSEVVTETWSLLGELEDFRDRLVGTIHSMVAAVLSLFVEVEVEALYPQANEQVELGVALRRQVAELAGEVASHLAVAAGKPSADTLRAMLKEDDERTARLLSQPAITTLRSPDRHALRRFHREAAALRAGEPTAAQARDAWQRFAQFLTTLQTTGLRDRLRAHDLEVAQEARAALERASVALAREPRQAMLYLAHAGRRVARLYGLSPDLDAAARQFRAITGQQVSVETVQSLIRTMAQALAAVGQDQPAVG
jgi:hypothetical protein